MGTPAGCSYANLFFAIHENKIYQKYNNLFYIKRYIDDIIGIWVPEEEPADDFVKWNNFITDLNDFHHLEWEVSPQVNKLTFLDITINLEHGAIITDLHHKDLNLYLYITPHSAHAHN